MELPGRIEREVLELHRFFQRWFNGSLALTEEHLARLKASWQEPFVLRSPSGELLSATQLVEDVRSQHAAFPKLRIEIRAFEVARTGIDSSAVATYEERHLDGSEVDCRLCTALFVETEGAPNGVRWVRLDEIRPEDGYRAL